MYRLLLFLIVPILTSAGENNTMDTVTLDPLVRNTESSSTLHALKVVNERAAKGEVVYNWGLGASPFAVPQTIVEAVKAHAHEKSYAAVEGIPLLSQTVANYYSSPSYPVAYNDVIVSGLKNILFDVQRCFGGEMIHVAPYWVSYAEQTRLLGKTAQVITTQQQNNFKLVPEEIEELCSSSPDKPRLIIFNHPVNPTGASYSPQELEALAKVFKKYQLIVFADEVYGGCHYNNDFHSIAEYYPERTIRASSLSKEFSAGGYRIGWAAFPPSLHPLKQAMAATGTSSYTCAAVPLQYAAITALQGNPEIKAYRNNMQRALKVIGKECAQRFRTIGLECTEPEAAWYTFIDFAPFRETLANKGIHNSEELVSTLVQETGIVFVPGQAFGMPQDTLYVRASFVDFSGEEAVAELGQPNMPSTKKMYDSIEVLGKWLSEE